jgi:hypothetical protein
MDIILTWLQNHIPFVATWVIGLPVVVVAIKKYLPMVRKYLKVSREVLDLLDTCADALQDDKITDDEIKAILKEIEDLKAALQAK